MTRQEMGETILQECRKSGPSVVAATLLAQLVQQVGEDYAKGLTADIMSIGVVAYALMLTQDADAEKLFGEMFQFPEETKTGSVE